MFSDGHPVLSFFQREIMDCSKLLQSAFLAVYVLNLTHLAFKKKKKEITSVIHKLIVAK